MWITRVKAVSHSLETTGYAHQVVNEKQGREITVAHHWHRNYDHIHSEQTCDGYTRQTGYGERKPDLTPHPDAVKIAAALNSP